MDLIVFSKLVSEVGPLVGVILFFLWRDGKREDSLVERIVKLEDYQRDTLINLVEHSSTALVQNTEALKQTSHIMEAFCQRQQLTKQNSLEESI